MRLNRVCASLSCNVFAKCEFLNPGGSVKDRIAYNMIQEAQKEGLIAKGATLIEPTSGNTGIGLALAGAVLGYKVLIIMPEKMSREKEDVLKALGADIIRTPTEVPFDDPRSHISQAKKLARQIPHAFMLDQYKNPGNTQAHFNGTAVEILEDLNHRVDMVVAGAGTGGTLTGIAKRIRHHQLKGLVVGVDPVGSLLAGPAPVTPYEVEGIGYDFIPEVLDTSLVDQWIKVKDKEAFDMALRLIREEGLLVGGSSGACVFAALKAAKHLKANQNCVVILPDSLRNYMSKFLNPQWRKAKGF